MNTRSGCFLLLLLLCCITPAMAKNDLPNLVQRVKPSIVTILTYNQNGQQISQGSGFFVSQTQIVTCLHVLRDAYRAEIKLSDDSLRPILGLLAEDQARDLALLKADASGVRITPLEFSRFLPKEGEQVFVFGSPMGLGNSLSDGIVSAIRGLKDIGNIIQITAPISAGSSGSAVVNSSGQVVGIASLQILAGQNLNFAVPGQYVFQLPAHRLQDLAEFNHPMNTNPTVPDNPLQTGIQFANAKEYGRALPYLQWAIHRNSASAAAWFYLGYCKGQLGDFDEAIPAFKNAIHLNPTLAEAHFNLGVAYANQEMFANALAAYKKAIRVKPEYARAHLNLGYTYLAFGDKSAALDQYKILRMIDQRLASDLIRLIYK